MCDVAHRPVEAWPCERRDHHDRRGRCHLPSRVPAPRHGGDCAAIGERIAHAAQWPVVGPLLYRLNVNRASLRMMARGHVYSDPDWLAGERLAQKMAVVTAAGAWSGSIRFVTGMLDPMRDSTAFQDTAQRVQDPILDRKSVV